LEDWTALAGVDGVYYREVEDTDAVQTFYVLKNNQVTVKTDVEMSHMNGLTGTNYPQLKFTAYAVQKANVNDVTTAWNIVKPAVTPDP
jgi:hypothetical protein